MSRPFGKVTPAIVEELAGIVGTAHCLIDADSLAEKDPTKLIPPLHGALLKNEQDVHLFERLAFLARREGAARPGQ